MNPPVHFPPQRGGFSLLELLIAVAVAAILLSIAMSTLASSIGAVHAMNTRGLLVSAIGAARTSAIARNSRVALCPRAPSSATCADSYHWEKGWIAFNDLDDDHQIGANEAILWRQDAMASDVGLISTSGRRVIVFQADGGNDGTNVTFTLCDRRGKSRAIAMAMSNDGRLHNVTPNPTRVAEACAVGGG